MEDKMTYQEYMETYHYSFGHDGYEDGERMVDKLEDLLEKLKDYGYHCPDIVQGGIPVKINISIDNIICYIEEALSEDDFAGEDYYMAKDGKEFLKRCFEEYNEKYANNGNYCDCVSVLVPEEMKYELGEDEIEAE